MIVKTNILELLVDKWRITVDNRPKLCITRAGITVSTGKIKMLRMWLGALMVTRLGVTATANQSSKNA